MKINRAEFHFLPGWVALRYRQDPATALEHFAHIDDGSANPIVLARANYWRGVAPPPRRPARPTGWRAAYEGRRQPRHGPITDSLRAPKLGLDRR